MSLLQASSSKLQLSPDSLGSCQPIVWCSALPFRLLKEALTCCSSLLEGMGNHLLLLSNTCHRWVMQGPLHPLTRGGGNSQRCSYTWQQYKNISRTLWLWHREMDVTHVLNVQFLLHLPAAYIQRAGFPHCSWVSVCTFIHNHGPGGWQRNLTPSEHCCLIPWGAAERAYCSEYLGKRRASCSIPQLPPSLTAHWGFTNSQMILGICFHSQVATKVLQKTSVCILKHLCIADTCALGAL